jgi:hypothetical protein
MMLLITTIILGLHAAASAVVYGFAPGTYLHSGTSSRRPLVTTTTTTTTSSLTRASAREDEDGYGPINPGRRRRDFLLGTAVVVVVTSIIPPGIARAAPKLRPDEAFTSLVGAREELRYAADTFLPERDWDGMREYFDTRAANMNNYENSAGTLLESKRLDAESKRDIGTIRRYGVGADVIIMYGGLKNELSVRDDAAIGDYDDGGGSGEGGDGTSEAEVRKYLRRTAESLDEVLAICRGNGFA